MAALLKSMRLILAGQRIPLDFDGCKMAIVVRTDINMGKGKTAAQCAHAAIGCYRQALNSNKANQGLLKYWELSGEPKIVLKVSSYDELNRLAGTAKNHGIVTVVIRDAGRTQLTPGTVSVLGIGPASNKHIEMLTSGLKLL